MTGPAALGPRAVAALAVRLALGLALVVVGWLGAGDEVALDRQAPWAAVATTGLLVGAASGALWLLGLRRAVSGRALALLSTVDRLVDLGPEPAGAAAADAARVRRVGAGSLYHRPGCALVVGRPTEVATAVAIRTGGLRPCEACEAGAA